MGKAKAAQILEAGANGATRVRWVFHNDLPIAFDGTFFYGVLGRYFGLVMDRMLGPDYETGLAGLKTLVEGMPNADIAGLEAAVQDLTAQPAYVVANLEAAVDSASSAAVLGAAYGEIVALAQANNIVLNGAPYTVIRGHGEGKWQFDAGIPVDRNDAAVSGRVTAAQTYAGKAVDFRHLGSYDTLAQTHAKAEAWLATRGLSENGQRMEVYVSDPSTTPAEQVLTLVRVPIK
jgi:effector-binding domain-containing protein